MARQLICGFEAGDFSECAATSGTVSIDASVRRSGAFALRAHPAGAATGHVHLNKRAADGVVTPLNLATIYARAYVLFTTLPAAGSEEILTCDNLFTARKFSVRVTSAGKLQAYDKTGTAQMGSDGATTLTTGRWYCLEVSIATGAAAAWEVRIDGRAELSGTGNLTTSNAGRFQLGKEVDRNGQSIDVHYDDVAIDDAAYPGPARIVRLAPNAAGSTTQWTGDYTDVDEVPHDSDSTYLTTSVSGDVELVNLEGCADQGISGILRTAMSFAVVRDEGGTSAFRLRLRSSGTSDNTANLNTGNAYSSIAKVYETDPNTGGAWTAAAIDALQVGVVANAAVAHRCTMMCVFVEFVPQAPRAMRHRAMQGVSG